MNEYVTAEDIPNLRLSDPQLSVTVSKAAIELDNAARGVAMKFEATGKFVRFLHASLHHNVEPGGAQQVWLDANTLDVFSNALMSIEGNGSLRTVEDVIKHAQEIVTEMESASEGKGMSHLIRFRRFCVASGNSLLSHRASLKQEAHINRHRR